MEAVYITNATPQELVEYEARKGSRKNSNREDSEEDSHVSAPPPPPPPKKSRIVLSKDDGCRCVIRALGQWANEDREAYFKVTKLYTRVLLDLGRDEKDEVDRNRLRQQIKSPLINAGIIEDDPENSKRRPADFCVRLTRDGHTLFASKSFETTDWEEELS